ncbi:MAG: peptidylprolyl isomerase [Aeromonadaceae bacterium]|nr:peptidylprolyl isomerase [Aeromonadaceae bacterium]
MLMDKLREGAQGRVAKIIFWLIILSFALAGVGSYLNSPVDTNPAEVNGEPITAQALETAYRNERSRMEAQFGESFAQLASNPEYTKQLRHSVLEKLVDQLVLDQQAHATRIRVGNEQVKETIRTMPEFQNEGKFDNERYLSLLSRAGLTPQGFSESIRQDLVRQNWIGGLVNSEFALAGEVNTIDGLLQQARDVTLYTLPVDHFMKTVQVSDAELDTYYKAHQKQFMSPDQVKISYVMLNAKDLQGDIKVSDQEARDYYDQHQDQYRTAERRQVAHILIAQKDDASALKEAEALLSKLKSGADFAKLATQNSTDKLSARKGGELDWFEKGVMDPEFEKAAFALQKSGDLSTVVKSQFGYHIIKLLGIQPETSKSFDQVKADVLAKVRQDKSHELFLDKQQQLADLSFENPDSLDLVAEKMGLKIVNSDFFAASTAVAPLNDPKVKQQAFSEDLREQNTNSEVINISDDQALVLHVTEFKHAAVRPLADVKADVTSAVKLEKAQGQVREQAIALLAKLNKGESIEAELKAVTGKQESRTGVTRMSSELDATLVQALFRMAKPEAGKSVAELVPQMDGDQVILVLNKVTQQEKPSAMKPMLENQLAQGRSGAVYQALLNQARADAKISYNKLSEQSMPE